MQIDITGADNVRKYIKAGAMSKFSIQKTNNKGNYVTMFDCVDSNSTEKALAQFDKLADVLNPNIVYKIVLFDFADISMNDEGAEIIKKAKNGARRLDALFILNNSVTSVQAGTNQQNNVMPDVATLRAELLKDIAKQQEESQILAELKILKAKFAELEEEEEEEESEGIAGIKPEQISQIMGLVNMFKTGGAAAAINGAETATENKTETKTEKLNRAVKILYKHDKELADDLLKLAEIAETKNETFQMLIATLRNM